MKTFKTLALAAIAALTACSPLTDLETGATKLKVKNYKSSGCKTKVTRASMDEVLDLKAAKSGDKLMLHVKHLNTFFGCGVKEVKCAAQVLDDVIIIDERYVDNDPVDCVCPWDLELKAGPLAPGNYTLRIVHNGAINDPYKEYPINLTSDLDTQIEIRKRF